MKVLIDCYKAGKTVFIFGNGGSAGTSQHMVNDLVKGSVAPGKVRLKVIGLADNMSVLTAYANDCGYDSVFVEPLKTLMTPGDVCIAISASGNSPNVVKAVEWAVANGGTVISLVGFTGGKLKELSQVSIHFKSHNYGVVEDAQLMFSHLSSQYMLHWIKELGADTKQTTPIQKQISTGL
ncbi:MAG: SIS domain-containing protein, partial [Bdellovibrionales bacterium]|nr:SIS domain-containing protein [Bdellovibrionales bacterium]